MSTATTLTDDDIEQFIYERCRRFVTSDMIPAIRELIASQRTEQQAAAEPKGMREALANLLWAATERDRKNRIRQFDEFVDDARAALAADKKGETK